MSKAIVLPVNILVVIVIATVATLGLVGVYGVGFSPFSTTFNLESVKNSACRELVMGGCKVNTSDIMVKFDANKNGVNDTGDTLLVFCINFYGRKTDVSCRQMCGCIGSTNMSSGGPCTPICGGKVCGSNSCGGTCPPGCPVGQSCNSNGQCVACTPKTCAQQGKQCGTWNNGCGGTVTCPACPGFDTCNSNGQCVVCVPQTCAQLGKQCGTWNNGCGGTVTCPACPGGQLCNAVGQCVSGCVTNCAGKQCGYDGCGAPNNKCGTCTIPGQTCDANGQCVFGPVNCGWIRLMCGSDPSCILCCFDNFGTPAYEETCGPAGCVGGVCTIGNRKCTTITC